LISAKTKISYFQHYMTLLQKPLQYGALLRASFRLPKTNVRKYAARAHNVTFWSAGNEASQVVEGRGTEARFGLRRDTPACGPRSSDCHFKFSIGDASA
jgi:hypothetical protein